MECTRSSFTTGARMIASPDEDEFGMSIMKVGKEQARYVGVIRKIGLKEGT